MPIKLPRFILEFFENDAEKFIPYAGHIEPSVVALMDNSYLGMLHLHGVPFEVIDPSARTGRMSRINTMLRTISDPDVTIAIHMVRHNGVQSSPQPISEDVFVKSFLDNYVKTIFKDDTVFHIDWFITVIIQAPSLKKSVRNLKDVLHTSDAKPLLFNQERKEKLENIISTITSTLAEYRPRRLGIKDYPTDTGVPQPITEIGSALYLIGTAVPTLIPHTCGPLASAIYTDPVVVGPRAFDLSISGQPRVGAMLSLKNYPSKPRTGMFNRLLSMPFPLVMTNIINFKNTGGVMNRLRLARRQMDAAGDSDDLAKDMKQVSNQITNQRAASCLHHFSLAVYGKDMHQLNQHVAMATPALSSIGGAAPVRETNVWYDGGALESAYWLQFPGCKAFKPRPGTITTKDFACMASLENFPEGHRSGRWGPSILRFKTTAHSVFDYVTHDDERGHFACFGRTGSGKSVLLASMVSAIEPIMGKDGIRLVIDKDEGNRLSIETQGGYYIRLSRNQPSGLAPLRALANTPRNIGFLHNLYRKLIHMDGRPMITQDEDDRLRRGTMQQLSMPVELRSMGGVREFLGYADRENGAGARFSRFCRGHSMGWLLDNDTHLIKLGPGLFGIDFTDLIPKKEGQEDDGSAGIAAAVIMHELGDFTDGRKIAGFFDECRFYLEPLSEIIEDISLTGRKKEMIMGLFAQQPEHILDKPNGQSLLQQAATFFIYPDANHKVEYLKRLDLSDAAIDQLKNDMTVGDARRFLLWREHEHAICEFDLSEIPELPILSTRSSTVHLMEQARSRVMQEFYALVKESEEKRKALT